MGMCVGSDGKPQPDSIYVDMAALTDKTGCFVVSTRNKGCMFQAERLASFEFDIDMTECGDVWAAPLWMTPHPWIAPGQFSGEVDYVELCPRGTVSTNFGCGGAPGEVQLSWAQASGLNGPKHFQAVFDPEAQGGTLRIYHSNLDGSARTAGAYYTNFLSQV